MLYYNVRKFSPGHYKSHALILPNSQVSEKKNVIATTWLSNSVSFRIFSDYLTESSALLAFQLKRLISMAFLKKAMQFYETEVLLTLM